MLSEENATDGASHLSLPSSSSAIPPSHTHPYHPLIALSNQSTQSSDWGVPGLWCMKVGLESTGLLDIDFEVTPDLPTPYELKNDEASV
ncbi:hypothetical protein SERLA73DRAFT_132720 [Serpula lacrymans var. lacrymans S7.3]|uniref:Uncharacterized protein n=1 Tax=Serpula lacrymans var. lacrymans (strain S7.3) TaxID=936435 RepID=F8PPB6_SERL3|nr:hypothetical protein SERLA73DRAFT_132720 [Serpula lacrymans var. lacrymans S7.3]